MKTPKLTHLKSLFHQHKKEIITVSGLFLLWRSIIALIVFIAQNRFSIAKDSAFPWISDTPWIPDINPIIQAYARWDSGWYLSIIDRGYFFSSVNENANVVFFPLYPLLMKFFSHFFGNQYLLAGVIISSLALYGSTLFLYFITKLDTKYKSVALLAVLFLLLYPYAFFHVAVYTESLFLFFILGAFYFARTKKWPIAAIFSALASITRPTGTIMILILCVEYLDQVGFSLKKVKGDILWLLGAPLGILMYMGFLFTQFGDPFLFMRAQNAWGRKSFSVTGMFNMISSYINDFTGIFTFHDAYHLSNGADFLVFILVFGIGIYTFFRIRKSYGLFIILSLLIPIMTQSMISIGRYSTVLFPMYILLALKVKKQPWNYALITLFAMLSTFAILMFVNSYWLG